MQFERLLSRGPIHIDYLDGPLGKPAADLVISFSSVGHDASRAPSPEFVATASGRGTAQPRRALFVMDESRSWASDAAFAQALRDAVANLAQRAPIGRIGAIGLSMGGFAALVAAQVLPLDVVLAFGPQSAPTMAGETRWTEWTARLSRETAANVSPPSFQEKGARAHLPRTPPPAKAGWTCLFHGLADDRAQAMGFAPTPGTDHLLFPGLSHADLVPHLKAKGVLAGLMEAAMAGDRRRLLRIASGAGGTRRRGADVPPA